MAAARLGEMRIVMESDAKMSGVLGAVHRERLRAQQYRFDQARIGAVADFFQYRGEITRLDRSVRRYAQTEFEQELLQVFVFRFGWRRVHAEQRRDLVLVE